MAETTTQDDLKKSILAFLKETFGGPTPDSSSYLELGAGLLQTIAPLTADAASQTQWDGAPTIAAHCAHLAYYVRVNHNFMRWAGKQSVDWLSSWRLQQVGELEWKELKDSIRHEYDALLKTLESLETWCNTGARRNPPDPVAFGISPRRDS